MQQQTSDSKQCPGHSGYTHTVCSADYCEIVSEKRAASEI